MRLDTAWDALERAKRMFADLCPYAQGDEEQAFTDRLPYVLDLLAGVSRQINDHMPRNGPVAEWWADQRTQDREAITQMRHAHLKRLEVGAERITHSHTMSSAGTYNGKPINSGDTVVWRQWQFVGGHFDGQEVLTALHYQLVDRETLITEAESRLPT